MDALAPQADPNPDAAPAADEGAPRWPAWYAGVAFLVGLVATFIAVGIVAAVTGTASGGQSAAFTVVDTLLQFAAFAGSAALLLTPPLALLGFIFCLVYERTGSIFPTIALHSFNNSIAYAASVHDGWRVSVVLGPLMIAACATVPRLIRAGPRPLAA